MKHSCAPIALILYGSGAFAFGHTLSVHNQPTDDQLLAAADALIQPDSISFALVGCQGDGDDRLLPINEFVPKCKQHLQQLVFDVDNSYTDVQLESVLKSQCWYEKKFSKSCDSGFEKEQHCNEFVMKVVDARAEELKSGSTEGYETTCEDYHALRSPKVAAAEKKEPGFWGPLKAFFNSLNMPKLSTTMHCILALTLQYFLLYTCLAIVRTLNSFKFNLFGVQQVLDAACSTVTYAPMLCVLFLGVRMRAIQLSQGETDKYQLPQPWVQKAMIIASTAVSLQVLLVILGGFMSGMSNVKTDADGNLDVSSMTPGVAVKCLTVLRYLVMAMLYGGFTAVVIGVFLMKGPKEIWGDKELPVSPAVKCTILLATTFFLIYLLAAITKTCFELSPRLRSSPGLIKLESGVANAKLTVNFAPMLCILFIGARMRALQIDPKNGNPQAWAQNCFYFCTFSVIVQALLVLCLALFAKGPITRGASEGDAAVMAMNDKVAIVLTAIRYLCLFALYAGIIGVIYSVFVIQHPEGRAKTPPVSPAMHCVINLTAQYFTIYSLLFICVTIKSIATGRRLDMDAEQAVPDANSSFTRAMSKAIAILEAARSTVMFAPMLCILFFAARMRALQLSKAEDGTIPVNAGPQLWVQEGMYLAVWAVFLQLIMAMLVPVITGGAPECDKDGNAKVPPGTHKALAVMVEIFKYISLFAMYGGAMIVVWGIWTMTPETLPPYSTGLMPGVKVPRPPVPAHA